MARLRRSECARRVVRIGTVTLAIALLGLLPLWSAAQPPPPPAAPGASPPGEPVADVRVVGQQSVPLEKIFPYIKTRKDRPYDPRVVQEDVRRLNRSRMFANVSTENVREPGGGLVVIFRVVERPVFQYVKYIGLRNALETVLAEETGLKPGQPVDPYAVSEGKRKIEEHYKGKGFNLVQVTVLEGSKPNDRGASYVINEGPQQQITGFDFRGNTIVSGQRLKTQIMSGSAWFNYFGGYLDKEKLDGDMKLLEKYYKTLGFLSVRIGRELEFDDTQTQCTVHFIIDEGPRCQITSVNYIGITKFRQEDVQELMELKAGEFYDGTMLIRDRTVIEQLYGSYGYVFANVKPEPRVSEDASRMDLVFVVEEGKRYRVGNIRVRIEGENPHTNIRTVLNRLELKPGDIIDVRKLKRSEVRLQRSQLFAVDPMRGVRPQILVQPTDLADGEEAIAGDSRPRSKSVSSQPKSVGGSVRGQSPDDWHPDDQVVDLQLMGKLLPHARPAADLQDERPVTPPRPWSTSPVPSPR